MTQLFGLDAHSFGALFLADGDAPNMRIAQDARSQGADRNDGAFVAHGGLAAGFQAWVDAGGAPLARLVDIRWVFPDADRARAYHRESLRSNSEGRPAVAYAPRVGDGCIVFGGTESNPLAPELEMTAYTYVFRVANVVVKLFAFASPAATLTPPDAAVFAERAAIRIRASAD